MHRNGIKKESEKFDIQNIYNKYIKTSKAEIDETIQLISQLVNEVENIILDL